MKACDLWRRILKFKKLEYPNLAVLAELVMCLSGSNSTVERSFSLLRNMLSDKRLSMHHNTMQMLLKIKLNDRLWQDNEREEILARALEIYQRKRRATRLTGAACQSNRNQAESDDSDDSDESD